ncbi:MAG TPA: iron-sulfur cluster repair di-iron protein [Candidatus Angelobacter sp.]|nr:iron-sulfur cluster repair di-iron protein [Candidatus Angelobacter sp.]
MKNITSETTVGEIVRAAPNRARIFENLGIDYCCGGKKSLGEICLSKKLDPATVIAMLAALDGASELSSADPDAMSLSQLCDHIEREHHDYLREELPRLEFLTRKVAAVHGDSETRLREVRQIFETFSEKMAVHTDEEEKIVFPKIRQLEKGTQKAAATGLNDILTRLQSEHDGAGEALARFRELTDDYTPPEWACNTFRALYDSLERLEKNMHQHVHKENNILFIKALAAIQHGEPAEKQVA